MAVPPLYPGVYVEELAFGDQSIHPSTTSQAVFLDWFAQGPLDTVVPVSSLGQFEQTFGGLLGRSEASYQVSQYFLNGGSVAFCLRVAPPDGGPWADPGALAAALVLALTGEEKSPLANLGPGVCNLLCLPCTATMDAADALRVMNAALAFCQDRRGFYLIDIPDASTVATPAAMAAWFQANLGQTVCDAGAVYYPRLRMADALNGGKPREVGSSGTMAGLYAATDAARGVWKAPAGVDAVLAGVEPVNVLTDADDALLTPLGINAIRSFAEHGVLSWGARTVRGADALASDWKSVPVRRLAQFIENSLGISLQWVVFAPNTEATWSSIRLAVGEFLSGLSQKGALFGYSVACDMSTTPPEDVVRGVVNVTVMFAPEKPAEFLMITLQLMTATAT